MESGNMAYSGYNFDQNYAQGTSSLEINVQNLLFAVK